MKVMVDINIFLDVFQKRIPHYVDSSILLSRILRKEFKGVIAGHSLTTIFYLLNKHSGYKKAINIVDLILDHFEIKSANKKMFRYSRDMEIGDFEDAVVSGCAKFAKCDFIITRNTSDFRKSQIPAITPSDFLQKYPPKT